MLLKKFNQILKLKPSVNIDLSKYRYSTLKSLSIYLKDINIINFGNNTTKYLIRLLENDFTQYDINDRLLQIKELEKDGWPKNAVILRYGEKNGTEIFEQRGKLIVYKSSREYYIKKYGKELGGKKYDENRIRLRHNFQNKQVTSNVSKELFKLLQLNVADNCTFSDPLNSQKEFFIVADNRLYFYDFVYKNKFIEFNGDF